jgi:hypothetical protein
MKNKTTKQFVQRFGIVALVAIIGFSMVGCDTNGNKETPSFKGGPWEHATSTYGFIFSGDEFTLTDDNVNESKGKFTVSGSKITFNTTHVWNTTTLDWTEWAGGSSTYTFTFLSSTIFIFTFTGEGTGYEGTWERTNPYT